MKTEMGAGIYDSPDYHALIRGIRQIDRAGGDSTLARLVTADFLEENGEEQRAAYVRTRCENPEPFAVPAGMSFGFVGLANGRLHLYEIEDAARGVEYVAERGFLSSVSCPIAWWMAHGPDICRRHPVREVGITDRTPASEVTGYMWADAKDRHLFFDYSVPGPIWERMRGVWQQIGFFKSFQYPTAATNSLNDAALRWAEAVADGETV